MDTVHIPARLEWARRPDVMRAHNFFAYTAHSYSSSNSIWSFWPTIPLFPHFRWHFEIRPNVRRAGWWKFAECKTLDNYYKYRTIFAIRWKCDLFGTIFKQYLLFLLCSQVFFIFRTPLVDGIHWMRFSNQTTPQMGFAQLAYGELGASDVYACACVCIGVALQMATDTSWVEAAIASALSRFARRSEQTFSVRTKQFSKVKMTETLQRRGTLMGHSGWVTQIATNPKYPDMILSASRGKCNLFYFRLENGRFYYEIWNRLHHVAPCCIHNQVIIRAFASSIISAIR